MIAAAGNVAGVVTSTALTIATATPTGLFITASSMALVVSYTTWLILVSVAS